MISINSEAKNRNMDFTKLLAIYGAIISSGLLVLRYKDREDKKRKLLVRIDLWVEMYGLNDNFISGRKGNQYIRIRIINQSANPNAIEKVELKSISNFLGVSFNERNVPLLFNHSFKLPLVLIYSEIASDLISVNMNPIEFHSTWKSNYEVLKTITQQYILVRVYDTQDKVYTSNRIAIKKLLEDFLSKEKEITTEGYYNEKYN